MLVELELIVQQLIKVVLVSTQTLSKIIVTMLSTVIFRRRVELLGAVISQALQLLVQVHQQTLTDVFILQVAVEEPRPPPQALAHLEWAPLALAHLAWAPQALEHHQAREPRALVHQAPAPPVWVHLELERRAQAHLAQECQAPAHHQAWETQVQEHRQLQIQGLAHSWDLVQLVA